MTTTSAAVMSCMSKGTGENTLFKRTVTRNRPSNMGGQQPNTRRRQLQRALSMGIFGEVGGAIVDSEGRMDAAALATRRRNQAWFVVDPRNSRWVTVWDSATRLDQRGNMEHHLASSLRLFRSSSCCAEANTLLSFRSLSAAAPKVVLIEPRSVSLALFFTAFVTPYEVALLDPPPTARDAASAPLFLLNRLIDMIFFGDMCLQFVLMTQTYNDREGVKWIDKPSVIAKGYLRGWFTLDLFSLIPSIFDIVPLAVVEPQAARWRACGGWRCLEVSGDGTSTGSGFLNRLKAFRVIRVFRLVKLVRLLRASRMLRRWETHISINYATLTLCLACAAYLVIAHWGACVLLLPTTFYDNPMATWLGSYRYCVSEPANVTAMFEQLSAISPIVDPSLSSYGRECTYARGPYEQAERQMARLRDGTCSVRCYAHGDMYAAAFFMSLQLICGTSGGEFDGVIYNTVEHVIFATVVYIGSLVWGYVVGTFVSVLANSHPDLIWFRTTLDQLNHFMYVNQLPHELRVRLREYFQQSRHIHRGQQRKQLMTLMSPSLQGEVAMKINQRWLKSVSFLQKAEQNFIIVISSTLHPAVFAPGEQASFGYLYIIHRGVALYGGRVMTSGSSFGHDMILRRQSLCLYSARAMSYLEVYRISRSQLIELARPFPRAWSLIRWEAFRLALKRTLIQYMRADDALRSEGKGGPPGERHARTWTAFASGGIGDAPALNQANVPANPLAVEDPTSLHQISRGVEKTREEIQGMHSAMGELTALFATKRSKSGAQLSEAASEQPDGGLGLLSSDACGAMVRAGRSCGEMAGSRHQYVHHGHLHGQLHAHPPEEEDEGAWAWQRSDTGLGLGGG
mmetsp:Transcript_23740/g.47369  ORF Transcript_23740/g.47369 Transcript_23740/m.47369 type:complete len:853 (-) Transcript_23740:227-2785(-)